MYPVSGREDGDIHPKNAHEHTPSTSCKIASVCASEGNNYTIQHQIEEKAHINQGDHDKHTFNKIQGACGISGQLYEIDLTILFLLRGVMDEKITNFHLATNMEEAGKFDDVVFGYKYLDEGGMPKSKIIFLQAKHRDAKKKEITLDNTLFSESEKGDFSIKKYFRSYLEIKQQFSKKDSEDHQIFQNEFRDSEFIIYTNCSIKDIESFKNIKKTNIEEGSILSLQEKNNYCYQLTYGGNEDKKTIDTLKYISDCNNLAKELVDHISSNKVIDIKKNIFEKYHIPLAETVIQKNKPGEGTLRKTFLDNNNNLSPDVKIFRGAFFEEMQKVKEYHGKTIEELKLELIGKNIKLDEKFGQKIEKKSSASSLPKDIISTDEIHEFLSMLKLFSKQPNQTELSELIKQQIGSLYKIEENDINLIYNDIHNKVMTWWKEENYYLTENNGKILLMNVKQNFSKLKLVGLAKSHIAQIEKLGLSFKMSDKITEIMESIRENQFINIITNTVLLSRAKVYQAIKNMSEYESEEFDYSYIFMNLSDVLSQQNAVIDTFESEISNLLIIECNEAQENIGELHNQLFTIIRSNNSKKIVLIAQKGHFLVKSFTYSLSKNYRCKEIQDEKNCMIDLTIESQEKLLDKTQVIFQGEEVKFSKLIDKESVNLIDEEVFRNIVNNEKIEIGKTLFEMGDTTNYYIDRIFLRNEKIKEDFQEDGTKIIVYDNRDITQTGGQHRITVVNLWEEKISFSIDRIFLPLLEDFKIEEQLNNLTGWDIIRSDRRDIVLISDKEENFKMLCHKYKKRNLHWLKKENNKFIWQKTHGSLSNIRQFVEVNEQGIERITDINDRVVIISDKPGMGKSTVLTKLVIQLKKSDPSLWVIRINLNDHTRNLNEINFNKNKDTAIKFLMDIIELKTLFEKELFKHKMYHQGKIALLFDGFDEICPDYKEKVEELLKLLLNTKAEKLWITTRPHMKNELEDKLNVFSYMMKPLCRDDQKKFLLEFWNKTSNLNLEKYDKRLNNYSEELLYRLSNSIYDNEMEFTGIPLQIKMLAEAFQDNFIEFYNSEECIPDLSSVKLNLVDLFQILIEKIFNIYFKEKKKDDITNPSVKEDNKDIFESLILKHKLMALKTLFSEPVVNTLLSSIERKKLSDVIDNVKIGKEKTGIVSQIINDKPSFIHRTFAEYFAASWLAETKNQEKQKAERILHGMFKKENKVLCCFFDRILTMDEHDTNKYKIHSAVLNQDYTAIRKLLADTQQRKYIIKSRDKAGRTALHLAAAYGYLNIVKMLLVADADISIADNIFGWRPLKYADRNNHWKIAELLLQKGANGNDVTKSINNIKKHSRYENKTLLHIVAEYSYKKLTEVLIKRGADINAFDKLGKSALHIAVEQGNLDMVQFLIEQGADINGKQMETCSTPLILLKAQTSLHLAVEKNNVDVLKLLIDKGADLNILDNFGRTPLYFAAEYGKMGVLKVLIENGADLNIADNYSKTPLCMAAQGRISNVLKVLIENGADLKMLTMKAKLL